ncbi:hypothetical protein P9112_013087 [Eukaryota sp. TZLM1-RC]
MGNQAPFYPLIDGPPDKPPGTKTPEPPPTTPRSRGCCVFSFLTSIFCFCFRSPPRSSLVEHSEDCESDLSKSTPSLCNNPLLPPQIAPNIGRKTLVLDLDETLVHTSYENFHNHDFSIKLFLNGCVRELFVYKRPYVDHFLASVAPYFEVVVFTASVSTYANPVIDILDKEKVITNRLFRDSCLSMKGFFIKDLSRLGRNLNDVVIVDNSPLCYMLHKSHAIPINSFFKNKRDQGLREVLPILDQVKGADRVQDVIENYPWSCFMKKCKRFESTCNSNCKKFIRPCVEQVRSVVDERCNYPVF